MSNAMSHRRKRWLPDCKWADGGRYEYLQKLKCEFEASKSVDAKHETLANLANFAYNPENYDHLHRLSVHQLFLSNVNSVDNFIAVSSLKGLCNLAPYPPITQFLCQSGVLGTILDYTKHYGESTDFIIHILLLLVTVRHSNHTVDQRLESKLKKILNELPSQAKNNSRVENLIQLLLNDT